jgi:hypothetical protein
MRHIVGRFLHLCADQIRPDRAFLITGRRPLARPHVSTVEKEPPPRRILDIGHPAHVQRQHAWLVLRYRRADSIGDILRVDEEQPSLRAQPCRGPRTCLDRMLH